MIAFRAAIASISILLHASICQCNCGTFRADFTKENSGVDGYFEVYTHIDGTARYHFDLDIDNLGSNQCDLANDGLLFHLHTSWENNDQPGTYVESAASPSCTSANLGGHYDPYLACGPKSEASEAGCAAIERTAADGYVYDCSSIHDGQEKRNGYQCEVGDLSGLTGRVYDRNGDGAISASRASSLAPNLGDFKTPSAPLTDGWSSVAFHCGADGAVLFCADLRQVSNVCGNYYHDRMGDDKEPNKPKPKPKEPAPKRQYAAIFDRADSGVEGRVDITLDSNNNNGGSNDATFAISLDLGGIAGGLPNGCDTSQGFAYHLHTRYPNDDQNGGQSARSSTDCGPDETGGHYDPTLACGPASNAQGSGEGDGSGGKGGGEGECEALGRTARAGYGYGCNVESERAGRGAACEVGDLSGRFGNLYHLGQSGGGGKGEGKGGEEGESGDDGSGPVALSFKTATAGFLTPKKSGRDGQSGHDCPGLGSLVIHCGIGGARLACARIEEVENEVGNEVGISPPVYATIESDKDEDNENEVDKDGNEDGNDQDEDGKGEDGTGSPSDAPPTRRLLRS